MEPVRVHAGGRQPEGGNGVATLGPEENRPPPRSGPTDRAPGQAEWLPPAVRSKCMVRLASSSALEQKRRRQKTDR
eukprot:5465242-Prymnesium_polylepis.1